MAERPPGRPSAPRLTDLLQIGAVCGVAIGIGLFVGYLVDRAAGTPPLFTFLGLAVGIVGAATGSYRVIRPFVRGASDRASAPNRLRRTGETEQKD
ncbi:MAG: AtpZ/AtpI family protein [Frankiaceae bacterium]|nr:AtpZ/AtpI family protein [Frankiaceae bacterium]MBV9369380.1 AtpZ/AtpI family protein [Frankiales bacterium]